MKHLWILCSLHRYVSQTYNPVTIPNPTDSLIIFPEKKYRSHLACSDLVILHLFCNASNYYSSFYIGTIFSYVTNISFFLFLFTEKRQPKGAKNRKDKKVWSGAAPANSVQLKFQNRGPRVIWRGVSILLTEGVQVVGKRKYRQR